MIGRLGSDGGGTISADEFAGMRHHAGKSEPENRGVDGAGRIYHARGAGPERLAVNGQEMSDDALMVLFARGDRIAAGELTRRLTPRAFAVAARVLGDRAEAEDVTQEAMLRLWRMAPDWQPGRARVSTWLYRVTVNLCIDRPRRGVPGRLVDIRAPMDMAPAAPERKQDRAPAKALQSALMQFPERQRQAVVLPHLEELTNPEIV
jgi:RNA polymerase sigma-70 factor (ECF subfamily)